MTLASDTSDFCSSVTSCLKDGSTACDTTTGECPPCIYALDSTYTCWEKDNSTNTCPFTGVRYDCSDSWSSTTTTSSSSSSLAKSTASSTGSVSSSTSSSSSDTSTDTSTSASTSGLSSTLITYGAIGLGAVLIFVLLLILCVRRRKMRRRREENIAANGAGNFGRNRTVSDKRLRGLSKREDAYTGPYNNILDSSKVNYAGPTSMNVGGGYGGYGGNRKANPAAMDTMSRVPTDESPRSFDGMLTDSSHSPAMLGGGSSHNSRKSHKSGGRSVQAPVVGGIGGFSNVNEYVQQDVSTRCTSTPNVFGEYLRMKQEMQFDETEDRSTMGGGVSFSDTISDLDSGKYSFASSQGIGLPPQRRTDFDGRSSMADSIADSIADSVTDSEYAEQLRARGESDCYSEMSYNDEKYSFSSIDGLDDSQVREGKREVEI
ncbi:hypothetical protein PHYBOEH_010740 [Phytophthora boehmeriae]|uniref:Uncharacterized protein n=1 Tax=Phytophthora boehmeriae TaxID=109152 RepID=A0A8T1VL09_9STRA|nr:hypothetical protein PHYBOEH_010740 [Phytophthora boehmeriae]